MAKLVVLDFSGHTEVEFKKDDKASIKAAMDRFNELMKSGHVAYKVDAKGEKTQTRSFEEDATEIIMHPQMVGG